MPREARKRAVGALAPTVTSALMICVAAALALLGHIRLKAELNRLYSEIGRRDRQVAEARRVNQKLQVDYEVLTSPRGLNDRLRDLHLDLIMPGDNARVVLPEPRAESLALAASGRGGPVPLEGRLALGSETRHSKPR